MSRAGAITPMTLGNKRANERRDHGASHRSTEHDSQHA
jgi:hypothetical protein